MSIKNLRSGSVIAEVEVSAFDRGRCNAICLVDISADNIVAGFAGLVLSARSAYEDKISSKTLNLPSLTSLPTVAYSNGIPTIDISTTVPVDTSTAGRPALGWSWSFG